MNRRHTALLRAAVVCVLACTGCDRAPESDTASAAELRHAAARGLPARLLPIDFGQPGYVPPRLTCASELRDPDDPAVALALVQELLRHDRSQAGDTTRTETYAEGLYAVSPIGAYGLARGHMLRVNCARQAATAVLSAPS